jgi:hypothetical protein
VVAAQLVREATRAPAGPDRARGAAPELPQ